MTSFHELRYEVRTNAAFITLDRPEHRNALTPLLAQEMLTAVQRAEADQRVRSIVITGSGSAFCAGADLAWFRTRLAAEGGCESFIDLLLRPLAEVVRAISSSTLPVVAAVNGPCAAGGFELLLRCDIVIASTNAVFIDSHSRRGLSPAIGGVGALVSALGPPRAIRMLMLSESMDATAMLDSGLVTEVCEPAELQSSVGALTNTLAARSPRSIAAMKRAALLRQSPSLDETLERDIADFRAEWGNPDMIEGISAFVEHREAAFTR